MRDKTYRTVMSGDGLGVSDATYWRLLEGGWYEGSSESVSITASEKLIFAETSRTSVEDTQGDRGWFSSFKCEAAAWKSGAQLAGCRRVQCGSRTLQATS